MEALKCIIIDDDPLITDLVVHYAGKTNEIEYCISCNDSVAGLKLIGNGRFDLLFLDLNMPTLNGKNILELKQDKSKVIMVTSDQEFAVDSYRYQDVVDYLVKPLNYDRFLEAVRRCLTMREAKVSLSEPNLKPQSLMIKDGKKWIPILVDDIKFIKSDSNYCVISCTNRAIMSLMNLKTLLGRLPSHFLQCHRSYIVNMQRIDYFTKEEIVIGEQSIPISNNQKSTIFNYMNA